MVLKNIIRYYFFSKMQNELNLLESIGRGKGRYFTLSRSAYKLLKGELQYKRQQILDKNSHSIYIKDRSKFNY